MVIALASCIASIANAQMAFKSGVIDFSYTDTDLGQDIVNLSFGGRADYDIGALGLQLDGNVATITDFAFSLEQYSVGIHINKTLNNGTKLGGFVGAQTLSFWGSTLEFYNIGAEAMMSFGQVDVETAIIGIFLDDLSDADWRVKVDLYYTVSPAFEVSLGVDYWLDDGPYTALYSVGANYQLPNMPLSIGAKYSASEGFDTLEFVASYEFGDPNNQRLFQTRSFPFFLIGI